MRDMFPQPESEHYNWGENCAWFTFGMAQVATAWFSLLTVWEGLRDLLPSDSALIVALGLEAALVTSAYLFSRLRQRRIYWLILYLLPATIVVLFSYVGAGKMLTAHATPSNRSFAALSSRPGLLFVTTCAIDLMPFVALVATRPKRVRLADRVGILRRWMLQVSAQVESTDGIFPWLWRTCKAFLFHRTTAIPDSNYCDFQTQSRELRQNLHSSLGSLFLPELVQDQVEIRLTHLHTEMEVLAHATQRKFDQEGVLALNDCMDAVQLSSASEALKRSLNRLLFDHFDQFQDLTRRFLATKTRRPPAPRKEHQPNAESQETASSPPAQVASILRRSG
jgi:hypothetical protein